ncbi:MAG TPA: hypothetical protein VFJ16_14100 [Longimicrobium sp.]|nr:hypothetical protein [Longimicrobium sp.]
MMKSNNANRIKPADLRVTCGERTGWVSGSVRRPSVGEEVICTGGTGVVVAVRGKTSDGSPLVQIQLEEPGTPAFYAAASNVLLAP